MDSCACCVMDAMDSMILIDSHVTQLVDVLKTKVSEFKYNQWLKPARFIIENDTLRIEVPNKFIRDWISENYLQLIKYEMYRLSAQEFTIEIVVSESLNTVDLLSGDLSLSIHKTMEGLDKTTAETPAQDAERPAFQPSTSAPATPSAYPVRVHHFNPKYSFGTFVVGNANQFCHAAASAVASNPGQTYNPLFIYGGVGLGKTHLLNAIALKALGDVPSRRIISITGEQFTNEMVNAIRYETTYEFRKKYRETCDILLIDDIQFIAGKERTQEEFFHTFNTLYESRKQIVLTSDRSPKDIQHLEERLRSRFNWGLIADIQVPDTETRVAILRKRAETANILLTDDVAYLIADKVRSNVRDLEGAFNRLSAFAVLSKSEITFDLAQRLLQDVMSSARAAVSFESIQRMVADHYHINVDDLKSARRFKTIAEPRQIAMYLCKKLLNASFPEIGQRFGGKDHSTVIHAVRKIAKEIETNIEIQSSLVAIEKTLTV